MQLISNLRDRIRPDISAHGIFNNDELVALVEPSLDDVAVDCVNDEIFEISNRVNVQNMHHVIVLDDLPTKRRVGVCVWIG